MVTLPFYDILTICIGIWKWNSGIWVRKPKAWQWQRLSSLSKGKLSFSFYVWSPFLRMTEASMGFVWSTSKKVCWDRRAHFIMTLYFLKIKAVLMSMCQILPRLGNYTEYVCHASYCITQTCNDFLAGKMHWDLQTDTVPSMRQLCLNLPVGMNFPSCLQFEAWWKVNVPELF